MKRLFWIGIVVITAATAAHTASRTVTMTFTPLASWSRPVDGNHSQEIVSATT